LPELVLIEIKLLWTAASPVLKMISVQAPGCSMLPIHKLLSRIRWDPRFRIGQFTLGYYDRVARHVALVPFETIRFPVEAPQCFDIWDENGNLHRIPFHRVRRVYRNGRIIWERRSLEE
jgi:uncharacterized protein (UPF0248 family)